jgi:hypothetical protein
LAAQAAYDLYAVSMTLTGMPKVAALGQSGRLANMTVKNSTALREKQIDFRVKEAKVVETRAN